MNHLLRLSYYVLVPVCLVMILAGVAYHFYGVSVAREEAQVRVESTARLSSVVIQRHLDQLRKSLEVLLLQEPLDKFMMFKENDVLDEAEDQRGELERSFERLARGDREIEFVDLYLAEGARIVGVREGERTLVAKHAGEEEWFRKGQRASPVVSHEGEGRIRITLDWTNEEEVPVKAVATLIYDVRPIVREAFDVAARHLQGCEFQIIDSGRRPRFQLGTMPDSKEFIQGEFALDRLDSKLVLRQDQRYALSAFRSAEWTLFVAIGCVTVGLLIVAALGTQLVVRNLRRAQREAEEANRAKSAFLANMSHEIRTPMNGVLGMLQILQTTRLSSQQNDYAEIAKGSAASLLEILNDVLDFSKIEAGRLSLESIPFSLRDLVCEALHSLAIESSQKGLELTLGLSPRVPDLLLGDPTRIRQILVNLVGNAIKFSSEGEVAVLIRLESDLGTSPALISFTVRDNGIGIPPEKQEQIFRAFEQADTSTTRRYGGTGLGLAITFELVSRMGGKLRLDSEEGRGSTFQVNIPFPLDASEHETPSATSDVLGQKRVLIVDDIATNRIIFTDILLHEGMEPAAVGSGDEALFVLRESVESGQLFDLILLDYMMPEMDGVMVEKEIRKLEAYSEVPVILLTSAGKTDVRLDSDSRIRSILPKPLEQKRLLAGILEAFSDEKETNDEESRQDSREERKRTNILLVEDSLVNRRVAETLLRTRGHRVTSVTNGREAVETIAESEFDLVLMDIEMPEMDGVEATRKIREMEQNGSRRTPIVAMTAHAIKGDRERFLREGMDDYLAKPVESEELFQLVERFASERVTEDIDSRFGGAVEVDLQSTLDKVGGDVGFVEELVATYRDQVDEFEKELRAYSEAEDWEQFRRVAHKVKGTVSVFSAEDVRACAAELESKVKAGEVSVCENLMPRLITMIRELAEQLEQQLSELMKR